MPLPSQIVCCARCWNVAESEGMVMFTESDGLALGAFSVRVAFTRDSGRYGDGGWSVSIHGHSDDCRVGTILGLYRVIEAEYGGAYGCRMTEDGRISEEQIVPWVPGEPVRVPGDSGTIQRSRRKKEEAGDA